MTNITDQQLDIFCQQSLVQIPNYTAQSFTALQVLYAIGCRPLEAVDLSLWEYDPINVFRLQPLKGNNVRLIDPSVLPQLFVDYFTGGSQEYGLATLSRTSFYFKKVWPTFQIYKGGKQAELYLYRYNYVKRLFNAGVPISEIKTIMGWKSQAMAERYVQAVLYYL
jgi:integrase